MTILSTHDTKRGEDTRARIFQLSDVSDDWTENVRNWMAITPALDDATGYFLLQNIIGAWSTGGVITDELRERLCNYVTRAIREVDAHTSWTELVREFELDVRSWIDTFLDGPLTDSIAEFVRSIALATLTASLSRRPLQLVGPGIPDIYQGTKSAEDSLVDPDSRRFIDYGARVAALGKVVHDEVTPVTKSQEHPVELLEDFTDADVDAAKLMVTHHGVKLRAGHPKSLVGGTYQPIFAVGVDERHLVGAAHGPRNESEDAITLATRRPLGL